MCQTKDKAFKPAYGVSKFVYEHVRMDVRPVLAMKKKLGMARQNL